MTKIYAHRGFSSIYPENSIEAIKEAFKYDYIDTADQVIEFSFFVSNSSSNTQNIFYVTTAGIENSQAYSLAIGNSYDKDPYGVVGYTNSEIGINSNPKDYATFQQEPAGTGDWTILSRYADYELYEAKIYNTALTDEQVAQEYWNCIDNLLVTEAENE